jgi:hypothetical protein
MPEVVRIQSTRRRQERLVLVMLYAQPCGSFARDAPMRERTS